jgi:signal transduction histidine kinase/HAMP domain-containing protein
MARAAPVRGRSGWNPSLRTTFLGVALAVGVPLVLLLVYLSWIETGRERGRVEREAEGHARALGARLEQVVNQRLEAVAGLAAAVAQSGGNPAAIEIQVRRVRQAWPDIERIVVADELGLVLAVVPTPSDGRRPAVGEQSWFKQAATSTEPVVGEAGRQGAEVWVGLSAPARAPEGQFRGAVRAELSLRAVQAALAQAGLPPGAAAEIVNDRGVIIARHPTLFLLRSVSGLPEYARFLGVQGGVGSLAGVDGETRLTGAVPIKAAGWTVAVGLPASHGGADTWRRLGAVWAGAAAVFILGLALATMLARRQVEGIARLRAAMRRLESGDLPPAIPAGVGGEVGGLIEGFNRMVSWLHGKIREYEVMSQVEEVTGTAISEQRSAESILPGLVRRVLTGMGADAGVVLAPEDNGGLVTRVAVGLPGVQTDGVRLGRGRGLAGQALAERQAIAVPDVEADYQVEEPFLREGGLRSVIAAPILSGDDVTGVLLLGYRVPRAVGPAEVQRLETMVRRMAQALDHARAMDSVRQNTAGLESQVAQQLAALQTATREQAEARRQVQEAQRHTQELEQTLKRQAEAPPVIKEVIVEKEVVRERVVRAEAPGAGAELRAAMQRTVSQELRAPLSALLDLPRLLVEGLEKPLGDEERQQLEILRDHGTDVLEVIDDLVILSGLEAGQVKIVKSAFDLPASIQRVVRTLQPRAASKGNRIDTDIKLHVGQIVSDAKRVEQILTNLLLNAIRYTEVGEIRVTCFVRDADVVLTVADDGAGFSTEEQARIFAPFLQVEPRDGRAFPGTGLSLTVCQRLAEALGGKVRVESEVDRGTWFTVVLPVQS